MASGAPPAGAVSENVAMVAELKFCPRCAGALGVRLGDTLHQHGSLQFRPELGVGDEADTDFMQSATGLIWRALVLWMFLILLVSLAHALG